MAARLLTDVLRPPHDDPAKPSVAEGDGRPGAVDLVESTSVNIAYTGNAGVDSNRRARVALVAVLVVAVIGAALALAVLRRGSSEGLQMAEAPCADASVPIFLRQTAFDIAAGSEGVRPSSAEYVLSTHAAAISVASAPDNSPEGAQPAYLLQVTGVRMAMPFPPRPETQSMPDYYFTVWIGVVSAADGALSDEGLGDQALDLSQLGQVRAFSLDPACAPSPSS